MSGREKPKKHFLENLREFCEAHVPQQKSMLDQRRQRVAAWYVLILSLGAIGDLAEVSGSFDTFYKYTNSAMLLLTLLWSVCYLAKQMSILRTVSLMAFTTQVFIALDTVYCAVTPSVPHTQMVILVNMLILTANITFSIATYQQMVTIVNVVIATATIFVCVLLAHNAEYQQYFVMMTLIFAFIGILGIQIARISHRLQSENETIKRDDEELMNLLRLNKDQLKLYVELAKKECDEVETRLILSQFNERTQRAVISNVLRYTKAELYTSQQIEKAFPELSPSEREIAQLILKGNKLGGICALLGKSTSNINTQRANIRRKLGLRPDDNLFDALSHRFNDRQ